MTDSHFKADRPAPTNAVITPQMIEAGVNAYLGSGFESYELEGARNIRILVERVLLAALESDQPGH